MTAPLSAIYSLVCWRRQQLHEFFQANTSVAGVGAVQYKRIPRYFARASLRLNSRVSVAKWSSGGSPVFAPPRSPIQSCASRPVAGKTATVTLFGAWIGMAALCYESVLPPTMARTRR